MLVVVILLDSAVLVSFGQSWHSRAQRIPSQNVGAYGLVTFLNTGPPWGLGELYDSANQTTRGVILSYIVANPGVYLRELANDLDFSMGVVQYHIWVLTRDGEVEDCRTGRFRRFFGAGTYAELERRVISLLKQGTAGRILLALSRDASLTHTDLARLLGISSQALTWQIGRLRAMGMVEPPAVWSNSGGTYGLPEAVSKVVSTRRTPALDST